MIQEYDNSYAGYVVYGKNGEQPTPIGIVSKDHKRKARATYVPNKLKRSLIAVEDRRFYNHNGVDYKGIARAAYVNFRAFKILEGGSTITQQLARNLMFDSSKSVTRKIKESISALQIERSYSKEEILNLFFDNVFWGKNIYGLRTASLSYFAKEPHRLSETEQILLLTALRGPNLYLQNESLFHQRYLLINKLLRERGVINKTHHKRNASAMPAIEYNPLSVLGEATVPYIAERVDCKSYTINSSIDVKLQSLVNDYIATSKYPVSAIVMYKGKIAALGSTYGSEYPLLFKGNVGSTLKPFLYTFFRENGISNHDLFPSYRNSLGWDVSEASSTFQQHLNIAEALDVSNNNVFINAANEVGIDLTLQYLASILNKDLSQIFPASILGATQEGLSLYELVNLYHTFFKYSKSVLKDECFSILNNVAIRRLGFETTFYLKTGTTNNNYERYLLFGRKELTVGIVRQENSVTDTTKEGSLIGSGLKKLARRLTNYLNREEEVRWLL